MALIFSYGDYEFNPKPLFTIEKEYIKTPSNVGLSTLYTLTLEGQIIPKTGKIPDGDPQAGLEEVFSGVDEIHRAFDNDFKLLSLVCKDSSPIISGYPRITNFSVNNANDNYVVRADYSITLELPALTGSGDSVGPMVDTAAPTTSGCGVDDMDYGQSGIISYTDNFTVEFMDERVGGTLSLGLGEIPSIFSIQRSITAQGNNFQSANAGGTCVDPYVPAWQRADAFIRPRLGFPAEINALSGLICPTGQVVNNYRSVSVDKTEGTVSVNETYLAITGTGAGYEDFQINTSQGLGEPYITVTVDGSVNGLTSMDYSGCPTTGAPKFNNALAMWSGHVSGAIFSRAQKVLGATAPQSGHVGWPPAGVGPSNSLNKLALSKTVGYNPIAGTITYSYTYDNRPEHCYSLAITEDITFTESEPNDIFASLTVLGKASGPLYQAIGTVGQRTRELSINAVLPMQTNCTIFSGAGSNPYFYNAPDVYDALVLNYANVLAFNYTQVFVTASSKTWEPKTGRFSLNQAWTVGSC
jgi:hypothetical protein